MTAQAFNPIILSASGATYSFFTSDYQSPHQERYIEYDIVKNQNGKFRWVYDNGPGFRTWAPFRILMQNTPGFPGSATVQLAQLLQLWNNIGTLGLRTPDGQVFPVVWAKNALEQGFRIFPKQGSPNEFYAVVQFEEAN